MKYTIENNELIAIIESKGAELIQISSRTQLKEFMWEGDHEIWAGRSPVLFPIIGLLKGGKYTHKGKVYHMPKHGFVRHNSLMEMKEQTTDRVVFELLPDEEIQTYYPFDFRFKMAFQLIGNKLVVTHIVENVGKETMYFSVGGHPAFKCPLNELEAYDDYYLEFETEEEVEAMRIDKKGIVLPETEDVFKGSNRIPLRHELFEKDAIIFKDLKSKAVCLASDKSTSRITVRYPDFQYLAFWAKPDGDYVCIEPWNGINDFPEHKGEISEKEGIIALDAGLLYKASYVIEVED